jgi:hypothetical protein
MFIGELLVRKNGIKEKISELRSFIQNLTDSPIDNADLHSDALSMLFDLLDKYQDYSIMLEKVNIENKIVIGESEINVANAIKLRNTIKGKIDVLSDSINGSDYSIDVFDLMSKRDTLTEEHILINKTITISDWAIDIE